MLTGVHQHTMDHVLLGAGVFLKDLDYSGAEDAASLRRLVADALEDDRHIFGATVGGARFTCMPKLRQLNANGLRQPYVGGTLCDGVRVEMSGTLIELSPENMAMLMGMADVERRGSMAEVRVRNTVQPEDYLPSLSWIGRYGNGFLLIELQGVLNMKGFSLEVRDHGEGSASFCFQAHAASPQAQDEVPVRMFCFEGGDEA